MGENVNFFLTFGAGLLSVLSPCVLPVLPVVVTGTEKDHRLRPFLVVSGLAVTFSRYPVAIRIVSSAVLILLGIVITFKGMVFFGAF